MSKPSWRIIEGILTTENPDGSVNVAPMGPRVAGDFRQFELRPFPGSRTYDNLLRTRRGVFHVTDNVEMIAQAAVGQLPGSPRFLPPQAEGYYTLEDCCRWYHLEAVTVDTSGQRARLNCRVSKSGVVREFIGFNRAKHAVLEAAIVATRVHLLPCSEVEATLAMLRPWVEKTGAEVEARAFDFLVGVINERTAEIADRESSP